MATPGKVAELITALKNKFVERADIFVNGHFETTNTKENGTITKIWNEEDGGGTQLIDGTSNVKSYVGVHEGGDGSGIYGQIYAIDKTSKTGTRVTIKNDAIYYTANKSNPTVTANDEIATKGDLAGLGAISIEKQAQAETGYASTYVISQDGVPLNTKINIPKDQMVQSASVEIVGATPNAEETSAGLTTGDKYILFVVDTEDSDNPTDLIIPVADLIDLQEADEVTLTLSGDTYSIKAGGVGTTQLADEAVTAAKLAPALSASLLTTSDVDDEVEDYIDAIIAGLND